MQGKVEKTELPLLAYFCVLLLPFFIFLALSSRHAPQDLVADTAVDAFSSVRAMEHLSQLAQKPHPLGSAELVRVREYLVDQIAKAGLKPVRQAGDAIRQWSTSYVRAGSVENIIARLPGKKSDKSILIVAHYDSVNHSPGASDDGVAVASMLEAMRVLKAGPQLDNDILFLFTDGEEMGMFGAHVFLKDYPAKNIGLVINFDARGSSGPVMMFETSDQNGQLIAEFAKAAPFPVANSLAREIYALLANDTDLSVFKDAGYAGLNFAFFESHPNYHSVYDRLDNVDVNSMCHLGSYIISLARHFGNLTLTDLVATDAVYFNVAGKFIHYSEKWVFPILGLVFCLFVFVVRLSIRSARSGIAGMLVGLGGFLVTLLLALSAVSGVMPMIFKFFPVELAWLLTYNHRWLLLGLMCLTLTVPLCLHRLQLKGITYHVPLALAIGLAIPAVIGGSLVLAVADFVLATLFYVLFRKGRGVWDLVMGNLLGWMILATVICILSPGASWIFIWPLFFSLIGLCFALLTNKQDGGFSRAQLLVLTASALPCLWWHSQFAYLTFLVIGLRMPASSMFLVYLPLSLLVPLTHSITSRKAFLPATLAIVAAVIFLLKGTLAAEFTERFGSPNEIFYALDADSDEAFWGSTDRKLNEWTTHYMTDLPATGDLSELIPSLKYPMKKNKAAKVVLAAPIATLLEDRFDGEVRHLKLHLDSQRDAPHLAFFLKADAGVIAAEINQLKITDFSAPADQKKNWKSWNYYALPSDGINLTLQLHTSDSFELRLTDFSLGVPTPAGFVHKAKPKHVIPAPDSYADMTIVSKLFSFPNHDPQIPELRE